MIHRIVTKNDYEKLLELDKKVYPTDAPVTPKILDSWYQNNPEFGIIFEDNDKIAGMCMAIPLNESGWKKLIQGELAESQLDSSTIFKSDRDKLLGIHIYHIEKLNPNIKAFYNDLLRALSGVVNSLKKTNPKLSVIGFSGLCVTSSGINLFYNKFNCKERNFLSSEHILSKNSQLIIVDSSSTKEINDFMDKGYSYNNRCKMLIAYPDEISIVWRYFNDGKGA